MVNSRPLIDETAGGADRATAAEWAIPGPSLGVQPMFPGRPSATPAPPLMQFISSIMFMLKLAVRTLGVMERLLGLIADGSVWTLTSQPLKGAILATLTW